MAIWRIFRIFATNMCDCSFSGKQTSLWTSQATESSASGQQAVKEHPGCRQRFAIVLIRYACSTCAVFVRFKTEQVADK